MKKIDLGTWNRREHFEFFSKMQSPFFGVVAEVECTNTYMKAKESDVSFFASYLHKSMVAVNLVKELKLRIIGEDVVEFETIHAGTTIGRQDGTFGFAFIPFKPNFENFNRELQEEILAIKNSTGLRLNNDDIKQDLIRHSTFPWSTFTGLLHPSNLDRKESVPKITFGKAKNREGKIFLPVSVEAHHGLVDGLHIARYLEEFEKQLK